jgi:hypothetical protein
LWGVQNNYQGTELLQRDQDLMEENIEGQGSATYDWETLEASFIHGNGKLVEHNRRWTGLFWQKTLLQ